MGKSNHWLKSKRKDLCIISLIMVHYVVKEVFRKRKFSDKDVSKYHGICFAIVNISI